MKAEKNSFIVYHDIEAQTAYMTDEQVGQLFRAMVAYSKGKEPCLNDPVVITAFAFVKVSMDFNKEKYDDKCRKNQESGRKGGRPRKNQTAPGAEYSQSEQTPANGGDFLEKNRSVFQKPDTVSESESDTDSEREDVSVSVNVLDSQDTQDSGNVENPVENNSDRDRDNLERDFQSVLFHARKQGYQFTSRQKKKLRQWLRLYPLDVVILAFDRATYYQARSVTYVFKILQEWQDKGLRDEYSVRAYIAERDGEEIPLAI